MRSSSGENYISLDHVRALAIFLVFCWHFLHTGNGKPIPFDYTPDIFIFSVFNEGHTGVSLFMVLSGYLFAKLLHGKKIIYPAFYWNRFIRLAPLLFFIITLAGIKNIIGGGNIEGYAYNILKGFILPTLPNGGWSITIEFHFYLLLPFLLAFSNKSVSFLFIVLGLSLISRTLLYLEDYEVRWFSYWTIIGRIDQFIWGIIAFRFRDLIAGRHLAAVGVFAAFFYFYWIFDISGGFNLNSSSNGLGVFWILLPAVEGMSYATLISYYDNSFKHSEGKISRFIALIGNYSYSIYLFHFFFVFRMADFIHNHLTDLSNFYVASLFSLLCLILMIPVGYLSFRFIEGPCLKLRKRYLIN